MNAQVFLTLAVGLLAPLAVQANEVYQNTLIRMDETAQLFVAGNNYIEQSVDELTGSQYYSKKTFPKFSENAAQVSYIDADLDALTRAILILGAQEVELPHVRYQINYSINTDTEIPELKHDYIEVSRYNLGPARHNDLLQDLDAENVASLDEFGVGPHVSWRFVMAPVMGMQAAVLYAARKEISDATAQKTMCFALSCLALEAPELPQGQVQVLTPKSVAPAQYRTENLYGGARPARVLEELWAEFRSDDPLPYSKDNPQFIFVISSNVIGQDSLVLGTGLQTIVLDDAIAKIWLQRWQVADMQSELTQVVILR